MGTVETVLPSDWQPGESNAIAAFRYVAADELLQIAYHRGRVVDDFPCPPAMYGQFVRAASRGRFVQNVMRPHARQQGWFQPAYRWPW